MAWSHELRARANGDLPRLADRHPDLQVAVDTAYVGTNWTAFGTLRGTAVVVKHFAQRERWLNEVACLRHLAASGTVPRVLDGDCEPLLTCLPDLSARLTGLAIDRRATLRSRIRTFTSCRSGPIVLATRSGRTMRRPATPSDLHAPQATWTAMSLALHTQAVIQGAFVLAKAQGGAAVAADSLDHLHRSIQFRFTSPQPRSDS